jgi:ergothioneine biosynthesis protein EgtB
MFAAQMEVSVRDRLMARLKEARNVTDRLFDILQPDALYERPIAERHRIVFYIGHLEAFDWNLLHDRAISVRSFNPGFDRLFAFGIDPVDGGLPSDVPGDWPSIDEVRNYVKRARRLIDSELDNAGFPASTCQLLNVAIEHRLMHAETLAYMFHQLPLERKIAPAVKTAYSPALAVQPQTIEIPAGTASLGQLKSEFGWDNEYAFHQVEVPAFSIDKYKVTNGDFLNFLSGGGYERPELWSDADWNWITSEKISNPAFWVRKDEGWFYRTMFDEAPLPLDWPVYASHAEASAYARWAGKALPTEEQWQRAAQGSGAGNANFESWDPVAVNAATEPQSEFGVTGMVGNGWEWTSSVFAPFGGFRAFSFYPGYSANFFDGKHYVMKGGSARTAACMLRPSFRNWFQTHYPFVYAGFRCVTA